MGNGVCNPITPMHRDLKDKMSANKPQPVYTSSHNKIVYQQLREDVKQIVSALEPKRRTEIIAKAIFFPLSYVLTYIAALTWGSNILILYGCYFVLGLLLVVIFLNLIHDAVHGTVFRKKWMNKLYVHFFDLMGANSYIWQLRHIRFHHNYPNVNGWDADIEQSDLFRVFPDGGYSRMHKYQHIYLPFFYPFYLANWLLVRDFKDFFNKNKTVRKLVDIPPAEYIKLLLFKAVFFFYMIVLPKLVLNISWWQSLLAFAILLFTASIFSLVVLLSPHANTESEFPVPDEKNRLPHSWMMHMLCTTNDITHDNFFTRFFMGCFNYHVAHHLFPNINHVYYPEITAAVKRYAEEWHLPYRQYTLATSLKNHYKLLKQNRMPESIFEETM
jgi:linoleoyl-CoA desaturase